LVAAIAVRRGKGKGKEKVKRRGGERVEQVQ